MKRLREGGCSDFGSCVVVVVKSYCKTMKATVTFIDKPIVIRKVS